MSDGREDLILDPETAAIIEAQRQIYIKSRDKETDPEIKFHYHLMAEIIPVLERAIYTHGVGLPRESIYMAILHACAKMVAEGILNAAPDIDRVDWAILGADFSILTRECMAAAVLTGHMKVGTS